MSAPTLTPEIVLRTSPHLHSKRSVAVIMRNVVYAMLPVCCFGVYNFGISVAALLVVSTLSCILTEHVFCRAAGRPSSIKDSSVIITGILLGLTLPPGFPLWMAAIGGFVAVGLGKMLFGGLGFNVFNPALVGRAFLQAAFPTAITTYTPAMANGRFAEFIPTTLTPPFMQPPALDGWIAKVRIDAFSGATPLTALKFDKIHTELSPLFWGNVAGSAGETSVILILLGGIYLAARKFMDWRITASMLLSALAMSGVFYLSNPTAYPNPLFMLFSGGLMLGAVFMATDMVASPVTPLGVWIYGAVMGVMTILIRILGGLPEGVMYAILLANAVSPAIDNLTQPRVYGTRRKAEAKA